MLEEMDRETNKFEFFFINSNKGNIAAVTYCRGNNDKELRAVCVGPGISHADGVGTVMSQVWVEFILEFSTPY